MSGTKLAIAVAVTMGIAFFVSRSFVAAENRSEQDPDAPKIVELIAFQNAMTKADQARGNKETPLEKLMRERTEAAQRELELRVHEFTVGRGTLDVMLECARNAKGSALDLAVNKDQELDIRKGYYALMQYIENLEIQRFNNGAIKQQDLECTRFARIDAQIQYMRAGGK